MTAAARLHRDDRGAVMLTGLAMACFLIGALWFVIGIGDAMVFHDQMQEAADHAAFTSAALHAKGMNFISACNLILLALIAIHIIMGIIHDILLAICIVSLGFACGPFVAWRNVYTNYAKIMKPVASGVHVLEVGAAYGYPYVAFAKGYTLGSDYGSLATKKRDVNVLAFSTSMIPGAVLNGPLNQAFARGDGKDASPAQKKGLPVAGQPMNFVCKKIGRMGIDYFVGLSGVGLPSTAASVFKGIVGNVLMFRYCNDLGSAGLGGAASGATGQDQLGKMFDQANDKIDAENLKRSLAGQSPIANVDSGGGSIDPGFDTWWGKEGPLIPWNGTSNGSPWQEIWAVNMLPPYSDLSEHRVALGGAKLGATQTAKPNAYIAEAEFFFDCTKDWADETCDGDANAAFAIKWRARLKRVQFPEVGSMLASFAGDYIRNLQAYTDFKTFLGNNDLLNKLAGNAFGAVGVSAIQGAINDVFKQIEGYLGGKLNAAGAGFDPKYGGIYH